MGVWSASTPGGKLDTSAQDRAWSDKDRQDRLKRAKMREDEAASSDNARRGV